MQNDKTIGMLFSNPPATWGLRGDPYLWKAMQAHFADKLQPNNMDDFINQIKQAFLQLTQQHMHETDFFFVEAFAHGGMSTGGISPTFWREKAIPLLLARFEAQSIDNH